MFVLAHLSDAHLGPLPRVRLKDLVGKRLLGSFNWVWRRHAVHRAEVLATIIADLKAGAPDHIAFTGDLVNVALELEFEPARAWLAALGPPERVTFVPGNHDVYVRATAHAARQAWAAYMENGEFPFVRRFGAVALIGLSTALPTGPLMASGRLGGEQLARLGALLAELAQDGAFRVVLLHHPPLGKRARHKRLVDAAPFLRILAEHGAELVLHGHDHRRAIDWIDGAHCRIPVVGVPSCSAAPGGHDDDPAGYHLYRIEGRPGAWHCQMVSRGLRTNSDGIAELGRTTLMG
jgi:3',5'-cyclic AMP phosphodiesterase CpdA